MYDVQMQDYELSSTVTLGGRDVRIAGRVAYPADPTGSTSGVSTAGGRFPLVAIMHGNHGTYIGDGTVESDPECPGTLGMDWCCTTDPVPESENEIDSFAGYDPLLEALARGGYIAVSINANDLNCEEDHRYAEGVQLFEEHLQLWAGLADESAPEDPFSGMFADRVDTRATVVMGHSRGGDRAIGVARKYDAGTGGIRIVSAVAIAPPWHNFRGKLNDPQVPLLLLYGNRDQDVIPGSSSNGGPMRLFDTIASKDNIAGFESLKFVDGANHAQWNEVWEGSGNDDDDVSMRIDGDEQREMLAAWGRAWVDTTVRGAGYRSVFTGDRELSSILDGRSRTAFAAASDIVVDRYENGDVESTPGALVSLSGGFGELEEMSFRPGEGPETAFHATDALFWVGDGSAGTISYEVDNPVPADTVDHVSVRAARIGVAGGPQPANGFEAALSATGSGMFVSTDQARAIRAPYGDAYTRTFLETVRLPLACLRAGAAEPMAPFELVGIRRMDNGETGVDRFALSE